MQTKTCNCHATLGRHAGFCPLAGRPVVVSSKQRMQDREYHGTFRKLREWQSRPVNR